MAYIVTNTDGTITVTVGDTTVDTSSYSLALIGRGIANYGQYFAQNTIRQLENFASTVAPSPSNALIGQLWYDKGEETVRVWDGSIWKRSTGIVVGNSGQKPQISLTGGTAFYNTTTNKLEVHNGNRFREAAYAGEVTSAYSSDSQVENPTYYGSRVRNLFLRDENGRTHPVLTISYVKSTATDTAVSNKGSTQIGEQFETIIALFSDSEFVLASDTNTPIEGYSNVNFTPELTDTGVGIASARSGRISGQILKGMNIRAEYESTGVAELNNLFVTTIGSAGSPVTDIFTDNLIVDNVDLSGSLTVDSDLVVNGTQTLAGNLNAPTSIATFANIVVTANSVLQGTTNIEGNLIVNGVNTQSIGTDTNKVETIFADNVDTQTLTVDGAATVGTLTAGTLTLSNALVLSSNLTVNGSQTTVQNLATQNITAAGSVNFNSSLNVVGATTLQGTVALGSTTTLSGTANIVLTNGFLVGAATQANVIVNNSTNQTVYPTFVDSSSGGRLAIQTDANFIYNPSTNTLTAGTLSDGTVSINNGNINMATGTIFADTVQANTFLTPDGPLDLVGGDITANTITANGTITGETITDGTLTITDGNITGNTATFDTLTVTTLNTGQTSNSATFTGTVEVENLIVNNQVESDLIANVTNTYDIGTSALRWATVFATTFDGVATSAQYADLAELYTADNLYAPGTIVKLGGEAEITNTKAQGDTEVFGVISTNPAYLMNSAVEFGIPVAMTGRVPTFVKGKVKKGERLITSDEAGVAMALGDEPYDTRKIIGRSLENKTTDEKQLIEVVVGVK